MIMIIINIIIIIIITTILIIITTILTVPPKGDPERGIRPTSHVTVVFRSLLRHLQVIICCGPPFPDPPLEVDDQSTNLESADHDMLTLDFW